MATLYHRKNEIAIDLTGIQNAASIDIHYSGKMYGESQLPDDWQLMSNKNRIVCLSLGNSAPEVLLNYVGLIYIKACTVIDRDLNIHGVHTKIEDIDYWENMSDNFDENTQYWTGLGNIHEKDRSIKYSSIVRKNLIAPSDEFYFKDGTPYVGEYHQHGDGQAMTGSEHTNSSELIYRKDANENIFNARKRVSKRQVIEIIKQVKPFIPITRKITKSDAQKIKESQKIAHKQLKEEDAEKIYRENRTTSPASGAGEKAGTGGTGGTGSGSGGGYGG